MNDVVKTWEEELATLLVLNNYVKDFAMGMEYAQSEDWQSFKEDGYTPLDAIIEDLSCGGE